MKILKQMSSAKTLKEKPTLFLGAALTFWVEEVATGLLLMSPRARLVRKDTRLVPSEASMSVGLNHHKLASHKKISTRK